MVARCHEGMDGRTSPLSSMSATWSVVTKSMSFTSPCRYDSLSVLTGAHLAMIRVAKHFLSGFLLPLTGGRVLLRHRSLLGVALAPLVLNIVLYGGALWLVSQYYEQWFGLLWPAPHAWYWQLGYVILRFGVFLVLLAGLLFSFVVVGTVVAAPFLDLLSLRVEQAVQGPHGLVTEYSHSWLRESVRALGHGLLLGGMWLALFPLSFLPGLGHMLWLGASWLLLAYNFAAFAFVRRPWSFREQWRRLGQEWATTLGFGAAVFCSLLIPLLGLVLLPLATIGGTLLVRRLDVIPGQ